MEHLLQPDPGLIIWTIVIFLGLVSVLKKFAWKPLLEALRKREEGIRKAIDDASAARQTADQLKAQYERELAQAQDKAQGFLVQARGEAQNVRDQMIKEAEAEARRLSEQTKRQLEEEKAKLSRELRQEVAGLSVRVAEKLLHHAMNAKEQESLVQGFLKDLEKDTTHN
jgi:F-type H+-transporting ATPase subunit b